MLVDSHAHLDVPNYDADRAEGISRARQSGVEMILEICGSDVAKGSLDVGLKLVEEYPFIYAAVGVHPHEASLYDEALERKLLAMSDHEKVIGWGEIGLDYHYDHSPRDAQRRVFSRQLQLALERRLPAIIHTREAEDDTIQILREDWADAGGDAVGGIIHCFTRNRGDIYIMFPCLFRFFLVHCIELVDFHRYRFAIAAGSERCHAPIRNG